MGTNQSMTIAPDRIVLEATRCGNTKLVDDRNGFPIEQPCDWEGIEEFAVFDDTEEVIGVCPECEQEIYLTWTATL